MYAYIRVKKPFNVPFQVANLGFHGMIICFSSEFFFWVIRLSPPRRVEKDHARDACWALHRYGGVERRGLSSGCCTKLTHDSVLHNIFAVSLLIMPSRCPPSNFDFSQRMKLPESHSAQCKTAEESIRISSSKWQCRIDE